MDGLDLKVQRKQKELLTVSRGISNLLDLAMAHGSQAAASRPLEEEKKQARLEAELELFEQGLLGGGPAAPPSRRRGPACCR